MKHSHFYMNTEDTTGIQPLQIMQLSYEGLGARFGWEKKQILRYVSYFLTKTKFGLVLIQLVDRGVVGCNIYFNSVTTIPLHNNLT